jgi:hypothetical protein
MKNLFQFHPHPPAGGENLAQPATFLPGQLVPVRTAQEFYRSKLADLAVFCGILNYNPAKNGLAQPLLNGGLQ